MDRPSDTVPIPAAQVVQGVPTNGRHRVRPSERSAGALGASDPSAAEKLRLASDDGVMTFAVGAAGSRLFIQRTQRSKLGTLAEQCLLIADRDGFRRWCAAEPVRFQYPILFDRLRRCGDELFDRTR